MKNKTKPMFMMSIAFLTLLVNLSIHIDPQSEVSVAIPIKRVAAQETDSDWPQVQHDAQHSGYISYTYGPLYNALGI
jgi:hypothetical protein